MNLFRFYLLIWVLLLITNATWAEMTILLPNPKIVGHRIKSFNVSQLILEESNIQQNKQIIYPVQLVIDIENDGKITAIKAVYTNLKLFKKIEDKINKIYKKWLLKEFMNTNMRLWRVESDRFAISLTKEKNCIELIILPFKKIK